MSAAASFPGGGDRNSTRLATTSIAFRLLPSVSSHELLRRRPSTPTFRPFARYWAQSSACLFQAETRTKSAAFAWKADAWYRLKLRVENLPNGQVRARGKAWPVGSTEPAEWTVDMTDPIGNREGAPGFFIDAQFGAYLDNLVITQNQ